MKLQFNVFGMKLFLHNCGANMTVETLCYGGHSLASTWRILSL